MIFISQRKQWKVTLMGTIAFCLLVLSGCDDAESTTSTAQVESGKEVGEMTDLQQRDVEKHIVFFGNSLTAGYGLEETEAFPALLQARLDSLNLPYVAVNAGLSGETTSGGLNRIDWVLNQPMDVFVLELGANDALRGLDLSSTRENLQGIIDKVRSKHPEIPIILAGMKAPPNMGRDYGIEFESIYRDLSSDDSVDLIPFLLEGVAGDRSLNLSDGIHPNVRGQRIVLENVWQVLIQHLKDPA